MAEDDRLIIILDRGVKGWGVHVAQKCDLKINRGSRPYIYQRIWGWVVIRDGSKEEKILGIINEMG